MLAETEDINVPNDHHFIMVFFENSVVDNI